MSVGGSLEDIVNDCAKLNDVDALKTYLLAIICELQQEIVKTKATVEDFRAVHKFDNIYEKGASINALVDPVVNSEILHLKQVLRAKEDELKAAKEQCEAQKFNPQAPIGRALFARCKDLMTENEELGRIVLQSQVQPLTLDLFKEREATKALKNQIMWMHQYNTELEEENDLLFNKSTKQAEEIAVCPLATCNSNAQMLRKEKEEMAKRLDGHHRKADPDSSQAVSAMESSVLSNRDVSPRRDESTKHEHRSSKDDKLRYRDKKPSERRDSDRRELDRRDSDRRDSDRRDPDRRESKHSERTKDDKYDDDKGLKRDSTKGVSSTSSIRKSERYSPRRDDRRGSSPKDTRSKRPERYRSRSRRNSRESVRDDRSPYRRRRRSRSPRSSRRY
ncbi:WTAP/Mum2p domain containing protein [Babesia gibsoni]|uniref:WTAP/Mum2p domain containing protein n=1 Tax=Babesia gibsoni TaxID=33632 RepID=A0AAD8LQ75_BABGI|nr:WTAP/Mum2p domain containing protein [Babesia gibsoni]